MSGVIRLPEVLCVHLKRFRHELMFSAKVAARVSFPINDLNMAPYTHKGEFFHLFIYIMMLLQVYAKHHGSPQSSTSSPAVWELVLTAFANTFFPLQDTSASKVTIRWRTWQVHCHFHLLILRAISVTFFLSPIVLFFLLSLRDFKHSPFYNAWVTLLKSLEFVDWSHCHCPRLGTIGQH